MATVYKIQLEVVSDFTSFSKEEMTEIITQAVESVRISKLRVEDVEVKIIA